MHPRIRALAAAASAAAVSATLLAAAPAAAHPHGVDWGPCDGADPAEPVECATIEVPLDYDRPRGEQIEIGLARRQAANPDERLGTIVLGPGGPGGSGVQWVIDGNTLTGEAAERFDLVGFDPLGVNTSTRVVCDKEAVNAVSYLPPEDEASFQALVDANGALAEDCRERTGELFDHVSNLETVEDLERVRRALGEGRLNYLGYSYGTLIGQQYAEAYPHRIRTMVLDGNLDHSTGSVWGHMAPMTAGFEENFIAFADWCEAEPECALHGEDVESVYADLKAKSRSGELIDPYDGYPLDFQFLTNLYTFTAHFPQAWPRLAADFAAMRDGARFTGAAAVREEPVLVENPGFPMRCQDWDWEVGTYQELESIMEGLAEAYPNVEWSPANSNALTCIGSGIEHVNEHHELDVPRSAPPIVFVGSLHDYVTVHEWSRTAAEQAGGHLVTYEGYWHGAYGFKTECVDDAVNAYFVHRAVPEADLSCPNADFPRYGASESAPPEADRY
ncbi:alpha/beta hydrolase [Glycomyces sp. A-F 0318]|uniref:alpha/beta fold hydrolase n=1 Tax=Glycomyces amatae TaxID=2881355 RepID=UPI001E4C3384|nr:alpha/beta hydrolase [Glycomyces amatae]MCD0447038.1 alpha/beta hydrolase [Glycomyces amatae]